MEGSAPDLHWWLPSPASFDASPWKLLSRMWTAAMGYTPAQFLFIPGQTAMSTAKETAIVIALYYLMIFYGRRSMKSRPAFELTTLFLLHNLFLSILSAFLLCLFVEELGPGVWKRGIYHSICGSGGWTKRLVTLYYVSFLVFFRIAISTPRNQSVNQTKHESLRKPPGELPNQILRTDRHPIPRSKKGTHE